MKDKYDLDRIIIAANQNIKERDYWWDKMSGELVNSYFPYDHNRMRAGKAADTLEYRFSTGLFTHLMRISGQSDDNLFIILAAASAALLSAYTGNRDIILGAPIYKQDSDGEYINTVLALRNQVEQHMTFKEFLLQMRETVVEANQHQNYPIEALLRHLDRETDQNHQHFPLFNTAVLLTNIHHKQYLDSIHPDMIFSFTRETKTISAAVEYNRQSYLEKTVKQIVRHLENFLEQTLLKPETKLSHIDFLSAPEKKQLLVDFNGPHQELPPLTIPVLWEHQVEKTPEHVALVGQSAGRSAQNEEEKRSAPGAVPCAITFRELNRRANRLAHLLRKKGAGADTIVCVLMDRSAETIIAIMGIIKAGSAYLPIDPDTPGSRLVFILEDSHSPLLVTRGDISAHYPFSSLQRQQNTGVEIHRTPKRQQITDLGALPIPNRSLVNTEKYQRYIGQSLFKNSISILASRGCPYRCAYCHKIWPSRQVTRSAENMFAEVEIYYNMGVRRFVFLDDIFNLDTKNTTRFFKMIIKNHLDLQLSLCLRGDILTREYIDLMIEAGTARVSMALETASPRLQKLITKNLHLEKFRENIEYIIKKYPQLILELNTMHGFPTETEKDALATLDFLKSLKWVHFPYVNILKIYQNTRMEELALAHGISRAAILRSAGLAYHEIPETLPFDKKFTLQYQADFLNDYFLSKERLLHVLPFQIKALTEDELVQKYKSYLPADIQSFSHLLQLLDISLEELTEKKFLDENKITIKGLNKKVQEHFRSSHQPKAPTNPLKILLLDLTQFFSRDSRGMLYDVVEAPIGLMYLAAYLEQRFGSKISCTIAKSRIDFDNYHQLKILLEQEKPHCIGIRSLTYYRDFFHHTAAVIRQWGIHAPIIAGGPYAAADYRTILQDRNINLAVLGEGEITFSQLIEKILENNGRLPDTAALKEIPGLAFARKNTDHHFAREILMLDALEETLHQDNREASTNPPHINQPPDLAYIIYTSGTTGKPKGVALQQRNLLNLIAGLKERIYKNHRNNLNTALVAPYVFDASVKQIFGALLQGHCLHPVPEDTRIDGFRLQEFYRKYAIDISDGTPGHIQLLLESGSYQAAGTGSQSIPYVKHFIIGGEPLSRQIAVSFFNQYPAPGPAPRITNIYGPSECCVDNASYDISRETMDSSDRENIPIGTPMLNQRVYIVDPLHRQRLQPIGVPGELCIAGSNVGKGYINNPELTADKFCLRRPGGRFLKKLPPWTPRKNFLLKEPGNQIYRSHRFYRSYIYLTGDLARWLPNGNIEFLGRIDRQIKIRGYRIEPAEIENLMQTHENVAAAAAAPVFKKDAQYLCMYIVTRTPMKMKDSSGEEITELRDYLLREVPSYMVPGFFMFLEKIPLTANGKIDWRALPEPTIEGQNRAYQAPRSELEEKLMKLWSQVLDIDKKLIGIDTDFFQLGGHSLKATILLAKIHREFKVRIHLSEMFTSPTIEYLAQCIDKTAKTPYTHIRLTDKKQYYPLSYAQRRLWVLCQFEADSTAYNIPGAFLISGPLNRAVLNHALKKLVRRHESLRTVFITIEGEPHQVMRPHLEYHMETIDLQDMPKANQEQKAREIYLETAHYAFNLETGPLFLFKCIQVGKEEYLMVFNLHHIITDGWSTGILFNEITILYNHLLKNSGNPLSPLGLQYKDYTIWHNALVESGGFSGSGTYWLDKFKDKPNGIDLPLDHSRRVVQTFNGGRLPITFTAEKRRQLFNLCQEQKATLFMGMLTLLDILLGKYTGQQDIMVGLPIAGRKHPELNRVIGFLVNTLVHRHGLNPARPFPQILAGVKQDILDCFEHQDYPFDLLIERLELDRDLSQSPLFNVMLAYENADTEDIGLNMTGLTVAPYLHSNDFNMSKFDLIFFVYERAEELLIQIEYNSDLFDRSTAERMGKNFLCLAENLLKNPEQPVYTLDYINKQEYEEIINHFNSNHVSFPLVTIRELLEAQVSQTPDHTAAAGIESEETAGSAPLITYQCLNQKANQLAHYLRKKYSVKPGEVIGVAVDRSLEMIVVLMGIVKSGAAYVAIDPNYPREQVLHMLKDSGCSLVIIDQNRPGWLENHPGEIINIYSQRHHIRQQSAENPGIVNRMTDILYVIYTSGSTGTPNGALLTHGILANLVQWQNQQTGIDASLNCLQFTSINFCVSFQEIFTTLTAGGKLHLIGDIERQDIDYLMNFITRRRIENLYLPFSYLNFLFQQSGAFGKSFKHSLKNIITAGEQLKITAGIKAFLERNPQIKLHNHYGSSEMHVVSSYTLDASTVDLKPIPPAGKPIANTEIYILDDYGQPTALGVWGELSVAGSWPVGGYINNPILTQKKLLKPRFLHGPDNKNLYCSGDIGRWEKDGTICLKGRKDDQIKVRGFRVEPGEIESKILRINGVKECTVVVKQDRNGQNFLAAYVVGSGEHISPPGIKRELSDYIPQHMIPMVMILERLPLLPNGKVDRERLPEPESDTVDNYIPPRNTLEKKLTAIWAAVLGIGQEKIGIDNNFFELGGHSLKAAALITRIHKELNVKVKLVEIFKSPFIRELAHTVKTLQKNQYTALEPVEAKEYYPLSLSQKRLYILQQMDTRSIGYNMPVVMTLEGNIAAAKLQDTFAALVRRHESLRTSFKIVGDEPVQKVHDDVEFKIQYYQVEVEKKEVEVKDSDTEGTRGLAPLPEEIAERKAQSAERKEERHAPCAVRCASTIKNFIHPFDLSKAPLLRARLVNLHTPPCRHPSQEGIEQEYILMVDMHHVISDGISMVLLVKEFTALFTGDPLPNLKIRFKDFAQWQDRNKQSQWMQEQQAYWLSKFSAEVPVLNLPVDFPRPPVQEFAGAALDFQIGSETTKKLNTLALKEGVTLYMLLLAVYNILLAKITGQEDIVVGTPLAGRRRHDCRDIIGMFVNTLPIQNYPRGNMTFKHFLQELKTRTLNAFENQDYPFEELVEQVEINRDISRSPLFDVMFTLQNIEGLSEEIPELQSPDSTLKLKPYHYEHKISKFDLVLNAREADGQILFSFVYRTKLFKKQTIRRFIAYFQAIVTVIEETPRKPLGDIEIISEQEKKQVLVDFNYKEVLYPGDCTVPELFAEQAGKTPDQIALLGQIPNPKSQIPNKETTCGEGTRGLAPLSAHFTYKKLHKQCNQLAHRLRQASVKPDTIVAIMVETSIEMLVGILGIMEAGAAYLPIDPGYPQERINYMLADSAAKILLTTREIANLSSPEAFNNRPKGTSSFGIWNLEFGISPRQGGQLAYVIYTSGTTGRPKGVPISHCQLVPLLKWYQERFQFETNHRTLKTMSYCFDYSIIELVMTPITGGTLYLFNRERLTDLTEYVDFINLHHINTLHTTPGFMGKLVSTGKKMPGLKILELGGERLTAKLVNDAAALAAPGCWVYNAYGPTEAAIMCSYFTVKHNIDPPGQVTDPIPIGKPIPKDYIYILDAYGKLLPMGIPGEIFIGGSRLAAGYLNQPDLTSEKFDHDLWDYQDYHNKKKEVEKIRSLEVKKTKKTYKQKNNQKFLRGVQKREAGKLGSWEVKKIKKNYKLNGIHASMQSYNHTTSFPLTSFSHLPIFSASQLPSLPPARRRQKIYKTGDLARWQPDGNICLLGRKDHQVKIRGYRIELEEIQYQLLKHQSVKQAVIITRKEDKTYETNYLCAYVTTNQPIPGQTPREQDFIPALKRYLAEKVPYYMIPSRFVLIDEIPLTASGKINWKALPEPQSADPASQAPGVEPGTHLEQVIAQTWQEVLKKNIDDIDDNFFDLGGNSLDFIMVSNKLKEKLDREIPVVTLFTYPTIRSLERYLNREPGTEAVPAVHREPGQSDRTGLIAEGKNLMKQTLEKIDAGE